MGILNEKRGRPPTGFQLHKSKWRFAWLLSDIATRAGEKRSVSSGIAMVMQERGQPVYFDSDGKLQINSNSKCDSWTIEDRNDEAGDTKARGYIARDGKRRALISLSREVARINKKLGNPRQFSCFADLMWANTSLNIFMLYRTYPVGIEMPFDHKRVLWNLGWGNPLSLLPWSNDDKRMLREITGHGGCNMARQMGAEAKAGISK